MIVCFDISAGHFQRGAEPCFCQSCYDELSALTDEQRAEIFKDVPLTDESDPISSIIERQRDGFR